MEGVVRTLLETRMVAFAWSAVECDSRACLTVGYQYHLLTAQDGILVVSHMTNRTRATLSNLIPYTQYIFKVRFINHRGEGPFSAAQEFRTLESSRIWHCNISEFELICLGLRTLKSALLRGITKYFHKNC